MEYYNLKKDFKIFENNPGLVYLDSTATAQKPSVVTRGVQEYLEHDYSNIHRGAYSLAERSEKIYKKSKEKVAHFLHASSWREIIYTYNSSYALNIIAQTLRYNQKLQKWDTVLLSIVEHHANIVPWLILKEEIGIHIEYIGLKDDFSLDFDDFEKKLDANVKVVSLTHVSNVTGTVFDVSKIGWYIKTKNPDIIFIIDASQSVPHFDVNVEKIGCDFLFFTGHKVMSDSGIWVLWWKESHLKELDVVFSWWWAIAKVEEQCFISNVLPDKFEPWTPNLSGAVSLLKAFEYIEQLWWYQYIEAYEWELTQYILEKFSQTQCRLQLIWSTKMENRVWVFSFVVDWVHAHDVADYMAEHNICIRAWQHCAEPYMNSLWLKHTCRMSVYVYNTKKDIDKFFEVLEKCVLELK